jgi:CubicO group peptidase (beta-lactamase class C family)
MWRRSWFFAVLTLAAVAQDPAARARRVEEGLRPPIVVKGQPAVKWTIAERLKHHNVPGVSVAVVNGGKIEWARGYGLADVESARPVTPETLFQAASISKPVAAMTVMRLVEQGKLSLDEDVNAKLKSWKVPENEFTKTEKVTLRRLASHSAGLTVHGFPGYAQGTPLPTLVEILDGTAPANTKPVRVDLTPGTKWRYAGGGYEVMQLLAEDVTGRKFPALAKEFVLDPLGMKDSTYEQPLPAARAGQAATGYRPDGKAVQGKWHTYPEQTAAGLWTTPSDLAKVIIAVQQGGGRALKPATVEQMLTKTSGDYGLGFGLGEKAGRKSFAHGGANEGFRCNLFAYRDGAGAVVMTNGDRGGAVASEILRAIAAEYGWPDYGQEEKTAVNVDPAVLQSYAGKYVFSPGPTVMVLHESGKMFLQSEQIGKVEILAESNERFFAPVGGLPPLIFKKNADGSVELTAGGGTAKRQNP